MSLVLGIVVLIGGLAGLGYGVLELIEVATGTRIPLPYSARLLAPAWRPGSSH